MPRPPAMHETAYERNQRANPLTRWLHGFRYRSILEIVDRLAAERPGQPLRVLEIGTAHGKLFEELDRRYEIRYVGIELDPAFCRTARERHGWRDNFELREGSAADPAMWRDLERPDLVVAMETLEHIPERADVRIIERVAALAPRCFVASVPVEVGPAIWIKNVGSRLTGYNRHKSYSWRDTFWAGLYQLDRLPPHGTGHRGFDWRWLAHTIRHYFVIRQIRRSPFPFVPTPLAFSVMFVTEPRVPAVVPAPAIAPTPQATPELAGSR